MSGIARRRLTEECAKQFNRSELLDTLEPPRYNRSDEIDRNVLKGSNVGPGALDCPRESRFVRILLVKEMKIKIIHAIPASEKLKGGTLAQCDTDQTIAIWFRQMRIASEEVCFFRNSKGRQRFKPTYPNWLLNVVLLSQILSLL